MALAAQVPGRERAAVVASAVAQDWAPECAVAPAAQKLDRVQVVALAGQEWAAGQALIPLVVDCSLCDS